MCLQSDVVERHLGCAIDRVREVARRHLAQARRRRPKCHELGFLGREKQWADGLEEQDDAKHIDLNMLLQIRNLHFMNRWEDLGDSRIGNDDVQSSDALALDFLNGCRGVGFGDAVDFDDDQGAAFASGEPFERVCCGGVAHGTDDDVVGARKVFLCEAVAQTCSAS